MKKMYMVEEAEILQLKEMLRAECNHKIILEKLELMLAGEKVRIPERSVLQLVSDEFAVKSDEILTKKKHEQVGWARKSAMYILHQKDYTMREIAECLEMKDHSSVIHGIHKVQERLKTDEEFAGRIRRLETAL